mgnify:CR=1 FL=1
MRKAMLSVQLLYEGPARSKLLKKKNGNWLISKWSDGVGVIVKVCLLFYRFFEIFIVAIEKYVYFGKRKWFCLLEKQKISSCFVCPESLSRLEKLYQLSPDKNRFKSAIFLMKKKIGINFIVQNRIFSELE